MCKYYRKAFTDGHLLGLVRLVGNHVAHYDGNETWNDNWDGAGQAYMDISGMGDWYLYSEIDVDKVEEIKRQLDEKYKKGGHFAYNIADHSV